MKVKEETTQVLELGLTSGLVETFSLPASILKATVKKYKANKPFGFGMYGNTEYHFLPSNVCYLKTYNKETK